MPTAPIPIVVDTREQTPWEFPAPEYTTVRRALEAGDYSLDGHEAEVAIERKSLDDYVQTIIHNRDRFERELVKLEPLKLRAVIVEASFRDLEGHCYRSLAHPSSVFGLTVAIIVDHGVPVFFAEDVAIASRLGARMLRRYWLKRHEQREAA